MRRTILALLIAIVGGCHREAPAPAPIATVDHLERGLDLVAVGRNGEALEEFTRAIEQRPTSVAYSNRGLVYHRIGQHDEALADHNKAVELDPADAPARHNRALLLQNMLRIDEALADFSEALRLDERYAPAYSARGNLSSYQGRYPEALADFRRAVQLAPNYFVSQNELAWLLATCPDDAIRDGTAAVEHAMQACELSGRRFEMLDSLGAAYAEAGEFDKAVEVQREAIAATTADYHAELRKRLQLYLDGKPYRAER